MMILEAMLVGKREGIDRTLNHVRKCDRLNRRRKRTGP
jgi:hypothetical protein